MNNIIMIGFATAGKTTVGKHLASLLNMAFIDIDQVIEELHQSQKGIPHRCRDILTYYGRECLIAYEREALSRSLSLTNTVVSTGGGIVLDEDNRLALKKIGMVVYLQVNCEVIFARMQARGFPAYITQHAKLAEIQQHCREREPLYKGIADIVVDNSAASPDNAVSAVVTAVQRYCALHKLQINGGAD